MSSTKKTFWLGLGVGVALTLLLIQLWGMYFTRTFTNNAQPVLLRPFAPPEPRSDSSEGLAHPWLPETAAHPNDNWRIQDLSGDVVTISSFKGKVLFLNFWSTSCVPCIEEMPGISKLISSLKGEQVQFVAVSDEDNERVTDFLRKYKWEIPIYVGRRPYPSNLDAPGIPATYILNKNGVIVYQHVGALNWDDDGARAFLRKLANTPSEN
jgi:thiol-disulfide isomerase/thioredoxin